MGSFWVVLTWLKICAKWLYSAPAENSWFSPNSEYIYLEDAFLIIIAIQCLCMGIVGVVLSNKNLFLLLVNIELIYLGGGLLFAGFSAYWFYDPQGIIYALCLLALAAAESVIILALFVIIKRRKLEIKLETRWWKKKFDFFGLIIYLHNEYLSFFGFFIIIVFILVFLLILLSRVTTRSFSHQKSSTYECGFEAFGDARFEIQAQFYIVGLLFLLFDVELIFLFPWVSALAVIGTAGKLAMFFFLNLLMFGLVYEWRWRVLEIFSDPIISKKVELSDEKRKRISF